MYISKDLPKWQHLLEKISKASEEKRLEDLLMLLLTADERDTLVLRLQIVEELLAKNHSQREIQQQLQTSAATITRGSNMMKSMSPEFLSWLKEDK